jgi:RES domain-containing protein
LELAEQTFWRVGFHRDPLRFTPRSRYDWSNRFDDLHRRWRTLYCAWTPEAALREVLADLRPSAATIARYLERYGDDAAEELPPAAVPAALRQRTVLIPVRIALESGVRVLDLTDALECRRLEAIHAKLLVEHRLARLDLHEITTRRREVTQTIATHAYDEERVGVIRYPSSIDVSACPCYALIEGRARLEPAGEPITLTDPPPAALEHVAAGWKLSLTPARPLPRRGRRSARDRS